MSKINVRSLSNENEDGAPDLVGITTFSATSYFVPTRGTTAQRPSDHVEVGSLRYNYDIKNLEYYRGHTIGWSQFDLIDPDLGGGTGSNTGTGTRGFIMGGNGSPDSTREEIEFITISTLGNSQDFGQLTQGSQAAIDGLGNRTNAFYAGGSQIPAGLNVIQKITVASIGNAVDYGDLNGNRASAAGVSNTTRSIIAGGNQDSPAVNIIEYFSTIQSGNSIDFGDLSAAEEGLFGAVNSSTRGLISGVGSYGNNTIEFITMSTTGNSTDFGDLIQGVGGAAGGGNSTRGIVAGGLAPSPVSQTNIIQFVTIATLGNAQDFGDLTQNRSGMNAMSSPTRAVFAAGAIFPTMYNIIDFVEIATTGNAVDFGDLAGSGSTNGAVFNSNAVSNGHGGL